MTRGLGTGIAGVVKKPFEDYFEALNSCFAGVEIKNLVAAASALIISWWVYVPVHELLHAFGCMVSGGQVNRLEISPLYGAELLKKVFSFVTSGSEYAGRLSGFDTKGSDLVYLLTDFLPYILTVFIGIPLLKAVSNVNTSSFSKSLLFGAAMPVAYAPFISITGDYYEMGSIVVSRIALLLFPSVNSERWRSDDVFRLAGQLFFSGADNSLLDIVVPALSFLLGVMLIYATWWSGILWTNIIFRRKFNINPSV